MALNSYGDVLHSISDLAPAPLPRFAGVNPIQWISEAEQYFISHAIFDEERFPYVVELFDDEAFYWFNSWYRKFDFVAWETFTTAMLAQFHFVVIDEHQTDSLSVVSSIPAPLDGRNSPISDSIDYCKSVVTNDFEVVEPDLNDSDPLTSAKAIIPNHSGSIKYVDEFRNSESAVAAPLNPTPLTPSMGASDGARRCCHDVLMRDPGFIHHISFAQFLFSSYVQVYPTSTSFITAISSAKFLFDPGSIFGADRFEQAFSFDPGPAMLSEYATSGLMSTAPNLFDDMPTQIVASAIKDTTFDLVYGSLHTLVGPFYGSLNAILLQLTKAEAIKWIDSVVGLLLVDITMGLWRPNNKFSWEIASKFSLELHQSLISSTLSIEENDKPLATISLHRVSTGVLLATLIKAGLESQFKEVVDTALVLNALGSRLHSNRILWHEVLRALQSFDKTEAPKVIDTWLLMLLYPNYESMPQRVEKPLSMFVYYVWGNMEWVTYHFCSFLPFLEYLLACNSQQEVLGSLFAHVGFDSTIVISSTFDDCMDRFRTDNLHRMYEVFYCLLLYARSTNASLGSSITVELFILVRKPLLDDEEALDLVRTSLDPCHHLPTFLILFSDDLFTIMPWFKDSPLHVLTFSVRVLVHGCYLWVLTCHVFFQLTHEPPNKFAKWIGFLDLQIDNDLFIFFGLLIYYKHIAPRVTFLGNPFQEFNHWLQKKCIYMANVIAETSLHTAANIWLLDAYSLVITNFEWKPGWSYGSVVQLRELICFTKHSCFYYKGATDVIGVAILNIKQPTFLLKSVMLKNVKYPSAWSVTIEFAFIRASIRANIGGSILIGEFSKKHSSDDVTTNHVTYTYTTLIATYDAQKKEADVHFVVGGIVCGLDHIYQGLQLRLFIFALYVCGGNLIATSVVFHSLPNQSFLTWTTILICMGIHGYGITTEGHILLIFPHSFGSFTHFLKFTHLSSIVASCLDPYFILFEALYGTKPPNIVLCLLHTLGHVVIWEEICYWLPYFEMHLEDKVNVKGRGNVVNTMDPGPTSLDPFRQPIPGVNKWPNRFNGSKKGSYKQHEERGIGYENYYEMCVVFLISYSVI